jgi:hypothetical protein
MFLPVNGDQYRNNVVLHLPMTGANNSTTFTDVSPSPKTITVVGNTKISTAQSKWGQGSGYFDGDGDYLSTPNNTAFDFGAGDFAIECHAYFVSIPTTGTGCTLIGKWNALSNQRAWYVNLFNLSGTLGILFGWSTLGSNGFYEQFVWTPSINTWYFLTITRSGNNLRCFVDGQQLSTTRSFANTIYASSAEIQVGAQGATNTHNGYLQDLRITKGVARYTADFAVPSGPLPVRLPELPVQRIQQPSFHQIARLGL